MGIPIHVMRLGQDCMDDMEDHPEDSEALFEHMQKSLEQFKARRGDKSIEGSYRPTNQGRENIMETVTLHDQTTGAASKWEKGALFKTLAAAGIHVVDQPFPSVAGEAAFNPGVQQQVVREVRTEVVKEAPLVTKSEERSALRQAELNDLVEFGWKHQAKKILWKMVEIAGMCIVIGGAILAGVWIANAIWRGPQDGPMPALQ